MCIRDRVRARRGKESGELQVAVQDLAFVEPAVATLGTIGKVPDRAIELLRELETIELHQAPSLGRQVRKSLLLLGLDLKDSSPAQGEADGAGEAADTPPRPDSGSATSADR